jgi:hypothetical protein
MSQIRYFTDVVLSRFDVIVFILGGMELASQVQESSFEYLIVVSRSRFGGDISFLRVRFLFTEDERTECLCVLYFFLISTSTSIAIASM